MRCFLFCCLVKYEALRGRAAVLVVGRIPSCSRLFVFLPAAATTIIAFLDTVVVGWWRAGEQVGPSHDRCAAQHWCLLL